jgi:hypothetical protein
VVTGVASHSSDLQRTISRVTTGIAVPLLLGLLASDVSGRTLVVYLALVALAHLWFERRFAPDQAASTAERSTARPRPPARTTPHDRPAWRCR